MLILNINERIFDDDTGCGTTDPRNLRYYFHRSKLVGYILLNSKKQLIIYLKWFTCFSIPSLKDEQYLEKIKDRLQYCKNEMNIDTVAQITEISNRILNKYFIGDKLKIRYLNKVIYNHTVSYVLSDILELKEYQDCSHKLNMVDDTFSPVLNKRLLLIANKTLEKSCCLLYFYDSKYDTYPFTFYLEFKF